MEQVVGALQLQALQGGDEAASLLMLSKYLAVRRERPKYFATSHPQLARDTLATGIVRVLPHRDAMGRRILLFRVGRWEPSTTSREEVFSAMILFLELLAREEKTQVSGTTLAAWWPPSREHSLSGSEKYMW